MAGIIPSALLDQIRAANDIVEVIGASLRLKRAGANFVALCPFHREKTPSFTVNPGKQIFYCFGCHKGGDVFTFVREYENVSFIEAVRRLAERARIPLQFEFEPGQAKTQFLKDTLLKINEQIAQRWQAALANDAAAQVARDYLARRGVSSEAIRIFGLGYAPDAWDDTLNWGRSKGYEPALLEQAGLVIAREGGSGYYDRFRGRLMFPICDEQGRVIGFSGRILSGDDKTAKYVNSPETPVFTKGKVIYGLDKTKRALLEAGHAIICEGQLDLISCFMAGVKNIVAPQGTALTAEHCRILKRYVDEVVLCFDADAAGQNAALRALDDLLESGLAIRVAVLPAPHDPDSLIREKGPEAFITCIKKAVGFFDFLLERLCSTHNPATDKGRIAILAGMSEALLKTANAVLIDSYAQKTAFRLGVAPDAVRSEFRKASAHFKGRTQQPGPEAQQPATSSKPGPADFWLLRLLLLDDDLVPWAAAHIRPEWIQHAGVRQIVQYRFKAALDGTWRGVAALLGEFPDTGSQQLITEAVSVTRSLNNRAEQIKQIALRLRDQNIDKELATLTARLGNPALSEEERQSILRRQQELRSQKKQPLVPIDETPSTADVPGTDPGMS